MLPQVASQEDLPDNPVFQASSQDGLSGALSHPGCLASPSWASPHLGLTLTLGLLAGSQSLWVFSTGQILSEEEAESGAACVS